MTEALFVFIFYKEGVCNVEAKRTYLKTLNKTIKNYIYLKGD